ncbi:MAG: caspase family protein [Cyanobacteria bacterium P01_C01_bin.89]
MPAALDDLQALIIGINAYSGGIPPLRSAVNDAREIATLLEDNFGYRTQVLCDGDATADGIRKALFYLKENVTAKTRFFFYFAGHGIALDGADSADGPIGYAIPQDATTEENTFLPMQELHDALVALPCKHLLVVLDCCFAGSFRWAGLTRKAMPSKRMYRERFDRFLRGNAKQVITSAAHDEKALDVLSRFGDRAGDGNHHSPFAELLMEALLGKGDLSQDGVTTATELYVYLNTELGKATNGQTPGISQLRGHDKGEFVFTVPGFDPKSLEPAPPLNKRNNPYRGLEAFDEQHADLFFGRQKVIEQLGKFVEKHSLTVVLGASGSGKSSLVKAGLLPRLKDQGHWTVLEPMRPGQDPFCAFNLVLLGSHGQAVDVASREAGSVALQLRLEELQREWRSQVKNNPSASKEQQPPKLLLVIDQCEELVTQSEDRARGAMTDATPDPAKLEEDVKGRFLSTLMKLLQDWPDHLRIILTLRSDFEPQFVESPLQPVWNDGRFVVPVMGRSQLKAAILEPAAARAIYFDPPDLVDRLIDEVSQTTGSLPLLSFALSELYLAFLTATRSGNRSDRAITLDDYETIGGVATSLARRADAECDDLIAQDPLYAYTLCHVLLRTVSSNGGAGLAKRRVNLRELEYEQQDDRDRIDEILARFVRARLFVQGTELDGSTYIEPAHDALVIGWQRLREWQQQAREQMTLHRLLQPAIREWEQHQYSRRYLWSKNPRLPLLSQTLKAPPGVRWFNRQEAAFARASVVRNQTLWRWGILASAGVLTAIAFSFFGARLEEWRARVREKSSNAELALGTDTAQGVLMALGAASETKSFWAILRPESDLPIRRSLLYAIQAPLEDRRAILSREALVTSLALSPYGDIIVTGQSDGAIRLWNSKGIAQTFSLEAHDSSVSHVSFYNRGNNIISLGRDGMRLWTRTGRPVQSMPLLTQRGRIEALAVSSDGDYAAISTTVSDTAGVIEIWDLKAKKRRQVIKDTLPFSMALAFSQDSTVLASGSFDSDEITLWSLNGRSESPKSKSLPSFEPNSGVRSLAFGPNGKLLASGSTDGTVRLWDHKKGLTKNTFHLEQRAPVTSLSFDDKEKFLTSGSSEGTIQLWDLNGQRSLPPRYSHEGNVLSTTFSRNGQLLFSGGQDGAINLWDMDQVPLGRYWETPQQEVLSLAIQPPARPLPPRPESPEPEPPALNSNAEGERAKDENAQNKGTKNDPKDQAKELKRRLKNHGTHFRERLEGHLSPEELWEDELSVVVTAGRDGTLRRWSMYGAPIDPPLENRRIDLDKPASRVNAVAIAPETRKIVSGGGFYSPNGDKRLRVWGADGTRNDALDIGGGHGEGITGVAIAPNGQWKVTSSADHTLRIWDKDGRPKGLPLIGHRAVVNAVDISPDSTQFVSVGDEGFALLWNRNGRRIRQIETQVQGDKLLSVKFTPDGKRIVVGNERGLLQWYNLAGKPTRSPLHAHRGPVWAIAFSPRQNLLATAGDDNRIGLWTKEGSPLGQLRGHGDRVRALAFTPNGHDLVSSGRDGRIWVWPTDWHDWLAHVCRRLRTHTAFLFPQGPAGEEAAQSCENIVWSREEAQGDRVEFLENSAWEEAKNGNFDRAVELLEEFVQGPSESWSKEERREKIGEILRWRRLRLRYRQAAFASLITRGKHLARAGKISAAWAEYEKAQKTAPHFGFPKRAWHMLCRFGGLYGQVDAKILNACNLSIGPNQSDNWRYHDARAIARILSGDFFGGIEDLKQAQNLTQKELEAIAPQLDPNEPSPYFVDELKRTREEWERWLIQLQRGRNPISEEVRNQKLSEFL